MSTATLPHQTRDFKQRNAAYRAARVEAARAPDPAPTPHWVRHIPERLGELLAKRHLWADAPVWGLAKRHPLQDAPFDEAGSNYLVKFANRYGLWDYLPPLTDEARAEALAFWQSWQDPATGVFKDPQNPDRNVSEKFVIALIRELGGQPRYPRRSTTQGLASDEHGRIDPSIFLERTRQDPDWAVGGWGVGSHTGKMAKELFVAINAGQPELIPALEEGLNNILAHQDPATGFWGAPDADPLQRLGGNLKVMGRFYFGMGLPEPHHKQLADTLLRYEYDGTWYRVGWNFCALVNVSINTCYCLETSDYRRGELLGLLASKAHELRDWALHDGTPLTSRNKPEAAGAEATILDAIGIVGGYLHWQDCPLPNDLEHGQHQQRGFGFRYRPVLAPDGSVKIEDGDPWRDTHPWRPTGA